MIKVEIVTCMNVFLIVLVEFCDQSLKSQVSTIKYGTERSKIIEDLPV